MLFACVGHMRAEPGQALDRPSCIVRGRDSLPWGREPIRPYVEWLRAIRHAQPMCMRFAAVNHKREVHRVAASVVIGVTEDWFGRFCDGMVADFEMTPEDLKSPSPYVLLDTCAIDLEKEAFLGKKSPVAQVHAICYQIAYHTRGQADIHIATLNSHAQYELRLRRMGFKTTGNNMHYAPLPIMRFSPKVRAPTDPEYGLDAQFLNGMKLYREMNSELWGA